MPMRAKIVSPVKLKKAISTAEANGPLKNRSALHSMAAILYNRDEPPSKVSGAIVRARIEEWGLQVKTPPPKERKPREPKPSPCVTEIVEEPEHRGPELIARAHVPVIKPEPIEHARRILAKGDDRARTLLNYARKHGCWRHVDWRYVAEQLGEKVEDE